MFDMDTFWLKAPFWGISEEFLIFKVHLLSYTLVKLHDCKKKMVLTLLTGPYKGAHPESKFIV